MKRILALALCLVALAASAQPVYRCGHEYSRTPCPQGKMVEATDTRTAAQRAEARRVAQREQKLAQDMENDRAAEQAKIRPASAGSLSGSPKAAQPAAGEKAPSSSKKKRKGSKAGKTEDFSAVAPAAKKAKPRK